ncbi:YheC/YheD family endospore coat-associated protein [Cytobacillus oceanisediminis]|uniref:YheC/YheD family endospore coat-associated protein n=1 Tax=Cytobacillus oceanisediminis TaxID=665099 RepID=UPI001C21D3CF|nr:YheC/YheD family protein [Cytobacillus oceanisediminis]MBU8768008.1 YheC/YheD family protein [Cytobacillus oceanisediminis]
MKIYYDWASRTWFSSTSCTLGRDPHPLSTIGPKAEQNLISFSLSMQNDNAGPVIGILTGKGKDQSIAGNGPLFKALQKNILQHNGVSFVFTAEDLEENSVNGYIYFPQQDKWIEARCPLPHLVYNRVPFRKIEKTEAFYKASRFFKEHNIPFFNPGFLDKFEVFQLFKDHPPLQEYIPETILVSGPKELKNFIRKYNNIYLKPANGSKGKGIYHLSQLGNGMRLNGLHDSFSYTDYKNFWNQWGILLTNKPYMAQKAISPARKEGKRFDFRILAHFSEGNYSVTGIGIRQSKEQDITTHIPNGGVMIPYESVRTKEHDEFIHSAVVEAGKLLEKTKGFYGEYSIDAGLTDQGTYVIYEINSKPMSFDEVWIEEKRIEELTRLFFSLAGFWHINKNSRTP